MRRTTIACLNAAALVGSTLAMLYYYVKSVSPARMEKKIGQAAYRQAYLYRLAAGAFEGVAALNYVLYRCYPLPLPLPRSFPWPWRVSALLAALIAIPSGYLMGRGLLDAGEESLRPKKEHQLYGGIYEHIRHPQALGEMPSWWVIALLLHSPFLVLYSFVWIPVFWLMCRAEEKDLAVRYGQPYEEYRQRTGFLLPKWGRKTASC